MALDIGGLWMGSFAYPNGAGPTTPFLANIEDNDGALSGTIVEPNHMGVSSDSLEAVLAGSRDGRSIDFTKVYDGSSDAAHAVDYVGQLSEVGSTITGVWSLQDWDGSFEMHREAVWEEAVGEEAEVVSLTTT